MGADRDGLAWHDRHGLGRVVDGLVSGVAVALVLGGCASSAVPGGAPSGVAPAAVSSSSLHQQFQPKIDKVAQSLSRCINGADCSAPWTQAVLLGDEIEGAIDARPDAARYERVATWSRTLAMVGEKYGAAGCDTWSGADRTCTDLNGQMTDAWLAMLEELQSAG